MPVTPSAFHAVVLAADRIAADPVARHAGVACKAAAPVAGQPLLSRVMETLRGVRGMGRIIVLGPARPCLDRHPILAVALQDAKATRLDPDSSPSRSAMRGLNEAGIASPVLITTADHALLKAPLVESFMEASVASGADLTVALLLHGRVAAAFPGMRRTVLRLGPGYCTCNLFAVMTAAGIRVIESWIAMEQQRKHPARYVAGLLGVPGFLRYLIGALSLDAALAGVSRNLGARIAPVILDDPEAGVDVDTPDDLRRVEEVLSGRTRGSGPA
jgi:GTP:adenosylcobinamide-phosphate guanylyltransferase